jgi:hypothetical protein
VPIRHVAKVEAHEIDSNDAFFDSLREGYPEFDDWWREKCVKQHRSCWVVYDNDRLAGLIVRKDEAAYGHRCGHKRRRKSSRSAHSKSRRKAGA